jgi:hypothetical protein
MPRRSFSIARVGAIPRRGPVAAGDARIRPEPPPPAPAELAAEAVRLAEHDPRLARRTADAALAAARAAGDTPAESFAERAAGMAAWELGDIAGAAERLRRAVAVGLAAGPAGERRAAEARRTLCWVLSDLGDTAGALREAELARPAFAGRDLGILLMQEAWVLQRADRFADALDRYRRARACFRRPEDAVYRARLLSNRSILFARRGALGAAEADLRRSEALFLELGQDAAAAKCRHTLGWVAAQRGDVPGALARYDAVESDYAGLGMTRDVALLEVDRCDLLLSVRLVPEARRAAERAVRGLGQAAAGSDRAEALVMLSHAALLDGDPAAAQAAAAEAGRAFARQRRPGWRALAGLARTRAAWAAGERTDAALARARRARAGVEAAGLSAAALEAALYAAHLALELGRRRAAERELARASRARRRGPADVRGRAWHAEALLRLAHGDRRGAEAALRAGLGALERGRAALGAGELRASAAAHGEALAALGLRLALERGRPAGILAWSERWRAGSLRQRPARPPDDADLARDLAELRAAATGLQEAALAGRDTGPLLRRQAALEEAVRRRSRRVRGQAGRAGDGAPPAPAALADALGERALLEVARVDGRLVAVTLAGRRLRAWELGPPEEVEAELGALRFALRRLALGRGSAAALEAFRASADGAAARLDALLLDPVRPAVDGRPLVVVPAGALHALPWGALPSCAGRPVTVAPSAALWLRAERARADEAADGPVVVVGGPDLEHAREEVALVARRHPASRRLTGRRAGVAAVARAMDGAALAHLAAHGTFRADNPLFSAIRLSDGPLTVHDLGRLARAPRRLVLSACEAGLSEVRPGEELMGLAAATLGLGTETLVASVGLVPDRAALELMVALHDGLRAGARPAEALASAGAALDDGPEALAARAGFLCLGAG